MTDGLLNEQARGVFVIVATPFDESGNLDLASTDSLIDFYLGCGVHGMTILGVMGEAPKLSAEESARFAGRVLQRVDRRVPVIVGVSNPGLVPMRELTEQTMGLGAAGVMVAPQPGLQGDDAVHGYLSRVFNALGPKVPICIQDYPPANGVYISPAVVGRLIDEQPQFVQFKHEDCPGLAKLSHLRRDSEAAGRRRISILAGNGGLYFPLELRRGADGAMTGFAFPDMLVEVYEHFAAGETALAEDLFDRYLPLVRYEQQPGFGLAVRKEILRRRGAIAFGYARPPGPVLSRDDVAELDHLLDRLDLAKAAA